MSAPLHSPAPRWHNWLDHTSEVQLEVCGESLGGLAAEVELWVALDFDILESSPTHLKAAARGVPDKGIVVRASVGELAEEAPHAYKDVDRVVNVVHEAGLARKVARLVPMGVIKG